MYVSALFLRSFDCHQVQRFVDLSISIKRPNRNGLTNERSVECQMQ